MEKGKTPFSRLLFWTIIHSESAYAEKGEIKMKKKIIAFVLIAALAVVSLAAASTTGTAKKNSVALGIGLGTHNGLAFKYGYGKFDLAVNASAKVVGGHGVLFSADVGAFYNVYDIVFDTGALTKKQTISLSLGPVAAFSVKEGYLGLDALFVVGAEYTWSKVPVTMFLKLGGGVGFDINDNFSASFAPYGVIGAVYTFNF